MARRLHIICHPVIILVLAIPLGGHLQAQEPAGELTMGYLRISVETNLVPIYLDGEPIGYTPIPEPIPVIPGWHHVSFFSPDFQWKHWTHRQREELANVVEAGTYRVFVEPGELQVVQMTWHELEQALLRINSGRWISAAVGIGMVAVVMILLTMAS